MSPLTLSKLLFLPSTFSLRLSRSVWSCTEKKKALVSGRSWVIKGQKHPKICRTIDAKCLTSRNHYEANFQMLLLLLSTVLLVRHLHLIQDSKIYLECCAFRSELTKHPGLLSGKKKGFSFPSAIISCNGRWEDFKRLPSKKSLFIQCVYLLQQSKDKSCQPAEIKFLIAKGSS